MSTVSPFDQAEAAHGRAVARVLLDSSLPQLDHLFDYAIPHELGEKVRVGQRVRVPFRSRERNSFGYIIEFVEHSDFQGELAEIADLVSEVPVLSAQVWKLVRAVADRAGGSAGDILRLAIPARQVRVEKRHVPLEGRKIVPKLESGHTQGDDDPGEGCEIRAGATRVALELLHGARLTHHASHGPFRLSTGEWVGVWAAQLAAIAIAVYENGKSVILITPDYRDLDQLRDALTAFGHDDTVRVDSRQSAAERYAGFLRARDLTPRIVLGNRSAVYAPAHKLGAILIWDDGDPVLAEPLAPYVHARDAALIRAEQSGAGLFLAGHTRSAEVQRLVDISYVRAQVHPPRRTRIVHADSAIAPESVPGRVPEYAARIIREGLRHGPVLVQVATPGYAPVALCGECGECARCRSCSGPIFFRVQSRPSCRWCGQFPPAWRCPHCGGERIEQRGAGSLRTAWQFERQFDGVRILVSDGEHQRERVDGRPALVVATRGAEPFAAAGYRAVVLLDAQQLLGLEHLRAAEDCLRWWENAAAMAAPDGICVIASGGGAAVQAFLTGQHESWLRQELQDRQVLRYPPMVRVASVTGGPQQLARALATLEGVRGVDHLGPTPLSPVPGGRSAGGGAGDEIVRAIVRFDYAQGALVAQRLRGALIADAAGTFSHVRGRRPGVARPEALRLRFDDRGVFDS